MNELNILGALSTTSTTKTTSANSTKPTDAQLANEELQKQFQPKLKENNKPNEPKFVEDKGEFDKIAKNYRQTLKKVNAVDQNTRTWTQDENGRYNDCPEVIEFNKAEDQFKQYINKKMGEPQEQGQVVVIVSNGNSYQFKALEKTDGTLFWSGNTIPM